MTRTKTKWLKHTVLNWGSLDKIVKTELKQQKANNMLSESFIGLFLDDEKPCSQLSLDVYEKA